MTSHPERRQKKITIGEVRAAGVRGVLIYYASCVYRQLKRGRSGDEVRPRWRVN
jgi:hypothetical protein